MRVPCANILLYCMADNFRGVLIFVILMVDLAFTKILPTKLMPISTRTPTVMYYYASANGQMMGMAKNIVAALPTVLSISK